MKWLFQRRASFSVVEFLVIFAGAFLFIYRVAGYSPVVLFDTAVEESYVQWCLQHDLCPLYGAPTNLAGFWQGGAWTYLRTFLSWLGLTPGGVHLLLQALDALAVALIALCGAMLHSRLAGVIAAGLALWLLPWPEVATGLHNSRFMFFPAGLCTLLCLVSLRTGGKLPLYLAAAAAAIAVNAHGACIPLLISVALVGALQSGRKALALFYWGGVSALFTVALAPGVWSYYLVSLFLPGESTLQPAFHLHPGLSSLEAIGLLAAAGVTARCILHPLPSSQILSSRALLAVLVPGLLLYVMSGWLVSIERTVKYVIFLIPACSLAAASAGLWLLERLKPLADKARRLQKPVWASTAAMHNLAPYAFGIAMLLIGVWGEFHREPRLLYQDLWEVQEYLKSAGYDLENQYRHVKSPQDHELVSLLIAHAPLDLFPAEEEDAQDNFYVIKTSVDRLPPAPPGHFRVSKRDDGSALVVARSRTWLNWRNFSACRTEAGRAESVCVDSGLRYPPPKNFQLMPPVPGLPHSSQVLHQRIQIRFGVRIPPASGEHAVVMPAIEFRCRGRIVSVPAGGSRILEGGRRALLASGPEPVDGVLVLEWIPGSRECPDTGYGAFPPFFIEAEPVTGGLIEHMLEGGR